MRVAIAEDSALFRDGLTMLLSAVGVEVTIQAATGEELLQKIDRDPPDVAILDIRMPPTHTDEGLDTARRLRAIHPDVGILLLSAYSETTYAARLAGLGARRLGYLLKDRVTDIDALRDALDRIGTGRTSSTRTWSATSSACTTATTSSTPSPNGSARSSNSWPRGGPTTASGRSST
jgi:DNA-binding NarL/FixJ family response regulator